MKFQAFINLIMILASLPVMAADGNSARSTYVFKTTDPQEMTVVNVGALSLAKRLDMIAKAKRSIEVEFFIYNIDQSGRLFTQALVKKAQEGVHVRVLVDYGFPIGKLDPYYATLLRDHGVEIRYYNPNLSFELLRGQFRSHRKGLVVDDQEAVTGGRNIADEYFDLAPDYNFLDRDVFVKGSMAKAVRESFDLFWSSNMTKEPERMTKPTKEAYSLAEPLSGPDDQRTLRQYEKDLARYEQETARATSYMTENDQDRRILNFLTTYQAANAYQIHPRICNDSIFAADLPGIGFANRVLFKEIMDQVSQAEKSIHIESPYFVTTIDGMLILSELAKKGIEMNVYTNSLNSTDAVYTTAAFYPRVGILINAGLNVYIYHGASLQNQTHMTQQIDQARWGIHAKSAVIDDKTIMVGTFNTDPRSRNINAEMAIMCRNNPELAQDVLQNMMDTKAQSVQLNGFGFPVDGTSKFEGVSLPKRIEYYLLAPFSNLLDFLL